MSDGRALMIAPEPPYPLAGGGSIRTASLLHYLAGRYATDLVVFRQPGEADPASLVPAGLAQNILVLDLPVNGRGAAARAFRNAGRLLRRVPPLVDRFAGFESQIADFLTNRRYEVAVIEHFWCAPYVSIVARSAKRTVLDLHNIESVLHRRCGSTDPWLARPAHRAFEHASRELECAWLPRFDTLLVASPSDAALVHELARSACPVVYPNALPRVPLPPRAERHALVFSGNFEYHPNISAVRFFRAQIWPVLRERWPGLEWRLVGKNPHGVARYTRDDSRIVVTGPVSDPILEIAHGMVAVVPLLAGSGTRVKILEAWAAGVPVVSTPLGAEGLPATHGSDILLAGGAAEFADAVSRLLGSPEERRRMGAAGRLLYERGFTWEAAWSLLDL